MRNITKLISRIILDASRKACNKAAVMCFALLCLVATGCVREPKLHLHQGGADIDMEIPTVDLDLKVIWNYLFKYDTEYDWQAEWIYGWDNTDEEMFGTIGYTEPDAFEVRRYFTGNVQFGVHNAPYRHSIVGNHLQAKYDFGFWDILAWNNINTPDGVQSVRIDENTTYDHVTAYTGQTIYPALYNSPQFTRSFYQPEELFAGYRGGIEINKNLDGFTFDENRNCWVRQLEMELQPVTYIYLVQVILRNNDHNGRKVTAVEGNANLSGMARSVNLNTGVTGADAITVNFFMRMKQDVADKNGDKVDASLNGEITHFYGSPSDTETDNPSQNIHSLHHEYWLRGLTSIATEGNVPSAVFQRPGAALFSPTDASGNALTNGVSYTFANTFFVDNYADKLYNQYANPYYATAHNYPDYLRLAGEVPYIVRFPGARYYEFDLSSAFYNDIFGAWEDAQTVTFNAYGDNHTGDTSYGAITIPITKGMATMVGGKYSHLGTFSAINVSNGNVYGMNDSGTAFDDASSLSTVTPFRTYMSPTATRSNARYDYTSVINIAEQNADNIMPDMEENEDDTQTEDHITVRAIGNQRVRIESTMATRLNVVTVAGQLYRILDVQPGIATYSDFQPGLYIFGTTKVIVR